MSAGGESVEDKLRQAMSRYPQGVTVVIGASEQELFGVTVSAFTSVSLKPPLVVIALAKGQVSQTKILASEKFTVNILASDQIWISERFAGKTVQPQERFQGVGYRTGKIGVPILENTIASIECRRWTTYEGGDHILLVGEVINVELQREGAPLVYCNRSYTTLSPPISKAPEFDSLLMYSPWW